MYRETCCRCKCRRSGIHAVVGDIVETTSEYVRLFDKYERCFVHKRDGQLITLKNGHSLSEGWLQLADNSKCGYVSCFFVRSFCRFNLTTCR